MKKPLDMRKTLAENGILDDSEECSAFDIPEEERYVPAVFIYFNDDLSVLWLEINFKDLILLISAFLYVIYLKILTINFINIPLFSFLKFVNIKKNNMNLLMKL